MAEAGQPGVREWPQYRMEEVARHCRKDDAWIVVRDQVCTCSQGARGLIVLSGSAEPLPLDFLPST